MSVRSTPPAVLAGTALWFAVVLTMLNWLRAGEHPPGWGWALLVVILVPGLVWGSWYERRRRDVDPDPSGPRPAPRSFADLPAVQKTRLVVVSVGSAFLLLAIAPLVALEAFTPGGSRASAGAWLFLVVLAVLAVLTPTWVWWRVLHPTRRMARQEQWLRKVHPARVYAPLLAYIPVTMISNFAFHAVSPEPAKFAVAFVINAALGALLVWTGDRLRLKASARPEPVREPSSTSVW